MEFKADHWIQELSNNKRRDVFGLIICAIFHQPKPMEFQNFYRRLIDRFEKSFNDDEKLSVYLYPIDYLHITVSTLVSFLTTTVESPEKSLEYWKNSFKQLKTNSRQQKITLKIEKIELSSAAGFFQFKDETNGIEWLRTKIRDCCLPEDSFGKLHIPNIVHTTFLRFIKQPEDSERFLQKFSQISDEFLTQTNTIVFDIDEVCLALESHPYMHIERDHTHVLDIMHC